MNAKHKALNNISKTDAFKKGKTSGNYGTHEESDRKEAEYRKLANERPSKYKRIVK